MVKSLNCIAKPGINVTNVGDLFSTVCGLSKGVCDGITANGTTGTYGAYGMCNATEQLSWAFNSYYQKQNANPSACVRVAIWKLSIVDQSGWLCWHGHRYFGTNWIR